MGFDPLNSGDYNRFESTSGSGGRSGGGNGWMFWFVLLMVLASIFKAMCS